MIEINLLPGSGKKSRGRGAGAGLGASFSGVAAKVKDPHLIFAVAGVAAALMIVAALQWRQTSLSSSLEEAELQAVQDSTRYAATLAEKRGAEARRDSVLRQLEIIRTIDNNRFVWPHLMDEVSRVMPPYTWLTSMTQVSAMAAPAAAEGDSTKKDSLNVAPPAMKFRIVGNTVDIQALTRFMKDLEGSSFVQNVVLDKSTLAVVDGKEVTEFQLSAEYQTPDSSAIRLQPIALSVR
jgi:Tfp pilus assembly protein PilN